MTSRVSMTSGVHDVVSVFRTTTSNKVLLKTGPGFLDNEWFSGAKLNFAENMLRVRDERVALICLGFMSNRKEAIFAMLAVASIGGLWGGPVPFYGARAASNIVNMMDPKFLITIDGHQDNGVIFPTVDYLPEIVSNTPTIEKVILVVTQHETRKKDLSHIRNCVYLEDFLEEGREPDGNVPDIVFEQLSFNQPLNINFTSGTTGLPKAAIHAAGSMISIMRDHAITYDLKSGDVVFTNYPVGWSVWDNFIPCLGLGLPLFLYCGSVYYTIRGKNFWDIIAKYKVKMVFLITSMVDLMEKMKIIPSPRTDMSTLKKIGIAGSPVKKENFEYLLNNVKQDLFVGIMYGATEVFGTFSGLNMNMPIFGGEIQVPSLGMDIKCYDSKGNSVIGRRGELVICKPGINFLISLWKDVEKSTLTDIYLSKYEGVWLQNDECWINPDTNGIIVIGRSDDTMKQNGERFGAADIYFAIHSLDELQDYICVSQKRSNGDSRAVLFVKTQNGCRLTPEIKSKIEQKVNDELYKECIPELILEIPDIPYNLNNKRMESVVRKIVESNKIPEVMNIRNPESLKHFLDIPEVVNYNRQ